MVCRPLSLIAGRGIHSDDGVAIIKPVLEEAWDVTWLSVPMLVNFVLFQAVRGLREARPFS